MYIRIRAGNRLTLDLRLRFRLLRYELFWFGLLRFQSSLLGFSSVPSLGGFSSFSGFSGFSHQFELTLFPLRFFRGSNFGQLKPRRCLSDSMLMIRIIIFWPS